MEKLTIVYFLPLTVYGGTWNGNNTTKASTFPLLLTSVSLNTLPLGLERVFITNVFTILRGKRVKAVI
jgi:hypothetical protein